MTRLTTVAEFSGLQIQIHDIKGIRWMRDYDVGRALGFSEPRAIRKLYQRHVDEFGPSDTCTVNLSVQGRDEMSRLFSQSGCVLLSMFANTQRAKDFRAWAKQVLVAALETGAAPPPAAVETRLDRIERQLDRVAGHMGELVGVSLQQASQQELASRYIAVLEMNQRGHAKVTPEIEQEVFTLHRQGMSQNSIARLLRISVTTVNQLLHGKYPRSAVLAGVPKPTGEIAAAVERLAEQARMKLQQASAGKTDGGAA